jgi:hypothetical protein
MASNRNLLFRIVVSLGGLTAFVYLQLWGLGWLR